MNEKHIEKLLRWLIFQEARKNTGWGYKNKTKIWGRWYWIKVLFLNQKFCIGGVWSLHSHEIGGVPFLPKNQADRWWDSFLMNIRGGVATTFWSNIGAALWHNNLKLTISCIEKQFLRVYSFQNEKLQLLDNFQKKKQ